MPGCVLHVVGKDLDPDAALSALSLRPYMKFRRGDTLFGRVCENGGFRCEVSSSDGVLSEEIVDATELLAEYDSDLRNLFSARGVEEMFLDFGYHLRIDGEQIIFQTDVLPAEFVKLCGSLMIGVHLSLYPSPSKS
jgi:hypothetical protein